MRHVPGLQISAPLMITPIHNQTFNEKRSTPSGHTSHAADDIHVRGSWLGQYLG